MEHVQPLGAEAALAPHFARQVREGRVAQVDLFDPCVQVGGAGIDAADGELVERWAENVVWEHFSGMTFYEPRLPCDATQDRALSFGCLGLGRCRGPAQGHHRYGGVLQGHQAGRVRAPDRGHHRAGECRGPPGGFSPAGDRTPQGSGSSQARRHRHCAEADFRARWQEPNECLARFK